MSREAGSRSKVAVTTSEDNIDPIGACIGQRGSRIQTIITELGGEKVDIVEWNDDVEAFIMNALSPAKIQTLKLNADDQAAYVKVEDDQLSLAIGKGGQNVRLAARLTGWKINISGTEESKKPEEASGETTVTDESAEKSAEEAVTAEVSDETKDETSVEVVDAPVTEETTEEVVSEESTEEVAVDEVEEVVTEEVANTEEIAKEAPATEGVDEGAEDAPVAEGEEDSSEETAE
ncbi:MAG: hypothetical protein P8J32_01175 [bacterium]|nr:hypothetical protein [bacterium]